MMEDLVSHVKGGDLVLEAKTSEQVLFFLPTLGYW